ncbi:uncharacterized protein BCR38DRAFT_333714 [Pseudomassariella vexata]|uniref:Conserved oligomeric Golgi complex subunit 1 n=1 Tax=Pseudomassariella vexata TaxID=1141098 RepID=A0A1Y2EFQ6_9PEZI|nr:uncharacterized protein BCR38DRAFT_333714 [Pseudomassariella vexata]ORY70144.1 hypothetical protein BCR38DRAFT_333714 [Pseudomassariella vexata]
MAAVPDTSDLTTSSQVFTSYTLPQIRAIHKSLHVQIDEKAARLRTQVGNSYRELLGTADIIVRMRHDMSDVQNTLGQMGGMCGRTVVGDKVAGLSKFRDHEEADADMGRAAKVKLLQACGLTVGRLLKGGPERRGERLTLAAKILVLSRLLISSFGDLITEDHSVRVAVESAKKSLGSMRRRLLRSIEKALDKVGEGDKQGDIIKSLCAYSLASSSGARDVLRHFLNVRGEAMALEFDFEEHGRDRGTGNVLNALDLYTRTLLHVQALVPTKLAEALAALKKRPLLADESLQAVEGLRLDIYERWCGEDIQYFTPFIRHDDLDGKQAKDMLVTWARKGCEALLQGLTKTLESMTEFKAIVDLRTKVLQHWIKDGGKAKGLDPATMLDGLRKAINHRLLSVLDTKVAKLRLVGSEVSAALEAWRPGISDRHHSLWDEEMLDMDVLNGSAQITHEVVSRLHGRNDAVSKAVTCYESWYHLMDDVGEMVKRLQRQRWDNDIDEIEDEETIEVRQTLLSKEDPQKIHEQLNTTLEQAFKHLHEQLSSLWDTHKDGPNNGQIAQYFLRILRDIRSRLPQINEVKSFGLDCVPSLHGRLAAQVSSSPIELFETTALIRSRVTGRSLWEGEPELPSQPSPDTFKLLRNLIMSMGDAGLDLWTPTAVKVLKTVFSDQLAGVWRTAIKNDTSIPEGTEAKPVDKMEVSGDEQEADETVKDDAEPSSVESSKDSDARRELLVQWLYDIGLLQICLGIDDSRNENLEKLADEVFEMTSLESGDRERMGKSAQGYWKRTSLLFGLLA